jgi:hypothetical protein
VLVIGNVLKPVRSLRLSVKDQSEEPVYSSAGSLRAESKQAAAGNPEETSLLADQGGA